MITARVFQYFAGTRRLLCTSPSSTYWRCSDVEDWRIIAKKSSDINLPGA
jgi:hypothetical protein